ncbi:hypothetical protein [Streptomyces sp. G-5]|uniref:hypothetical protein n=1 Tax=Streptomyces sp. G-5 TaxID=2977231 RepID=UPI0021D0BE59|nr:hypothetical protein [Streptomyces sp. G-5]MCU4746194.1 hypothetical protein [Streptomyces sp. G-5]
MPVARVRGHARARARVMAACLLFGLLAALGGPAGTAAAAAPAGRVALAGTPGFCPGSSGVSVVVDFQGLGGGRIVRCAPGPQADGLAALRNAGFEVGGTTRWGDAFICRINGRPGADSESCVDTPPATAYWSYWHAPNGGAWTYSQRGATYRTPPEGSIEGWSFALTDDEDEMASPPGVAPQRPADNGGGGDGGGSGSPGGGTGGGGAASGGSPSGGGSGTPGGSGGSGGSNASGSGGDAASGGSATGGQDGTAAGAPGGEPPQDTPEGDAPDAEDPDGPDAEQEDKDTDADRDADEAAGEDPAAEETAPAPAPTEAAGWSGQDNAHDPSATAGSGGPSAGTLAAIGLATALAAGAGLTAWRRRPAANAPTGSTTPTSTTDTATDQ